VARNTPHVIPLAQLEEPEVSEQRDDDCDHTLERALVVERSREHLARLCEHYQALSRLLLLP
jgi:hypothetical protein